MEIKKHKELSNIINKLNTYKKCNVEELINELNKDWPKEASLYFLSMIYDKRGFDIVYER